MTNIDAISYIKKGAKDPTLVTFDRPKTLTETRKLAYRLLTEGKVKTIRIREPEYSSEHEVVYLCMKTGNGYLATGEVMKQDDIKYRDYSLAGTILNTYILHPDGTATKYDHEKWMEKAKRKALAKRRN